MPEMNEHLDEGTIHAWLDDALPPDESARVAAHAAGCAACAAMVAEARGLAAASSRILSSLDDVPAGVIPSREGGVDQLAAIRARRRATAPRWWRDSRVLAAASLLLVAGVGRLALRTGAADGGTATPAVSASGDAGSMARADSSALGTSAPAMTAPTTAAPKRPTGTRTEPAAVASATRRDQAPAPAADVAGASERKTEARDATANEARAAVRMVDSSGGGARQAAAKAEAEAARAAPASALPSPASLAPSPGSGAERQALAGSSLSRSKQVVQPLAAEAAAGRGLSASLSSGAPECWELGIEQGPPPAGQPRFPRVIRLVPVTSGSGRLVAFEASAAGPGDVGAFQLRARPAGTADDLVELVGFRGADSSVVRFARTSAASPTSPAAGAAARQPVPTLPARRVECPG